MGMSRNAVSLQAPLITLWTGIFWGAYWLPVRALAELGLAGAWGTLAITLAAAGIVSPVALARRRELAAADPRSRWLPELEGAAAPDPRAPSPVVSSGSIAAPAGARPCTFFCRSMRWRRSPKASDPLRRSNRPGRAVALHLLDGGAQVDIMVTDVGLSNGMNGRQVAEAVRVRRPELPLLFITGDASAELPPGAEVIDRPFDLNTPARKVETSLSRP